MTRGLHCQQQRKKQKPHSPLHRIILKEHQRKNGVVRIIILFIAPFLDTSVVCQKSTVLIQNPKTKAGRTAILLHIKKIEIEEELRKELLEQGA